MSETVSNTETFGKVDDFEMYVKVETCKISEEVDIAEMPEKNVNMDQVQEIEEVEIATNVCAFCAFDLKSDWEPSVKGIQ